MGPGDVPDNRPDEPACGEHGDAHMYDDGHVVECVECLLIEKREMLLRVSKLEAAMKDAANDALDVCSEPFGEDAKRYCRWSFKHRVNVIAAFAAQDVSKAT